MMYCAHTFLSHTNGWTTNVIETVEGSEYLASIHETVSEPPPVAVETLHTMGEAKARSLEMLKEHTGHECKDCGTWQNHLSS